MANDNKNSDAPEEEKPRRMRGWSPSVRGGYQPGEGEAGGPPTGGSGASKKPGD